MDDWRRYTGTQMLQAGWTILSLAIAALLLLVGPFGGLLAPPVFLAWSLSWIAGLVVIALYDRRQWNRMVEGSSFQPDTSTRLADLETIKSGRSVTVTTEIPETLAQSHLGVRVPVENVSASFTIRLTYVGSGGSEDGLQTGNEALDEAYVIRGTRENVAQLLSAEVQAGLMDVETPGTFTITGSAVEYEVPFARLDPVELETLADTCVLLAKRIEQLDS
jgi:hypothetical protein